jgi:hypothetical protein
MAALALASSPRVPLRAKHRSSPAMPFFDVASEFLGF